MHRWDPFPPIGIITDYHLAKKAGIVTQKTLVAVIFVLFLTGCALGQVNPAPAGQPTPPPPTATQLAERVVAAAATVEPTPTAAPSSTPTATATSSPSATPTATVTPTPTATPTHPLMIEVMRRQSFPGSEITFEQILDPTDSYERYIVSYQSEGNKIYALLTKPLGGLPADGFPMIIFNHGYIPPDEYRTTERYVEYVDYFARNGYMVFRSDYRGHGFSEGEATGGYSTPDYTIDVLNGVAAVKTLPSIDPNRIGMWGHSMGGHITLRSMVVNPEIRAGVIWGGVVVSYPDLFTRWRRGNDDAAVSENQPPTPTPSATRLWRFRRWAEIEETYGTWEENPVFWASISSNSYVADLSGPIQLHHGTADDSVPYEFSEILEQEILAAGRPVELYLYEGDNHNISVNFETAMARSLAFFDRYVKFAD